MDIPLSSSPKATRDTCAREPIHQSGAVQPHGALLAVDTATWQVEQVSANSPAFLSLTVDEVLQRPLATLLDRSAMAALTMFVEDPQAGRYLTLRTQPSSGAKEPLSMLVHRSGRTLVLELEVAAASERLSEAHHLLPNSLQALHSVTSLDGLYEKAVDVVHRLAGFDRVMLYRFDEDWNGTVLAERTAEDVPVSYLGLRFPATDIPRQARALYARNWLRLIPDASYEPVPLVPLLSPRTQAPLDLSDAMLRSISPLHVEYMQNMGVAASMSVSIMVEGRLWGLIACHHLSPHHVPHQIRVQCELLAQVFASLFTVHDRRAYYAAMEAKTEQRHALVAAIERQQALVSVLLDAQDQLLDLFGAEGGALRYQGQTYTFGRRPPDAYMDVLFEHLWAREEDLWVTDHLSAQDPDAAPHTDTAAGLLGLVLNEELGDGLLLVRPEVRRMVRWGGKPDEAVIKKVNGEVRIHPRQSFRKWQEVVQGHSAPWTEPEVDTARELAVHLTEISLQLRHARKASELERVNRELDAFSYSISHDLRAPLRAISGYASRLTSGRAGELSDAVQGPLERIASNASDLEAMVQALLESARLARQPLRMEQVDMNALVADVLRLHGRTAATDSVEVHCGDLPPAEGDRLLLRQVWANLIGNAFKYLGKTSTPTIEIGILPAETGTVYYVRDNGVGFDMDYKDKLFEVFQRLHSPETFEGTGVGLSTVRRIVERHHGRVWATSEPGQGATFFFTLNDRSMTPP